MGYIKLNSFTQTASHEVRTAFKELKDHGMQRLVFDLRGNGGGLLREADEHREPVRAWAELNWWWRPGTDRRMGQDLRTLSEPLDTRCRWWCSWTAVRPAPVRS